MHHPVLIIQFTYFILFLVVVGSSTVVIVVVRRSCSNTIGKNLNKTDAPVSVSVKQQY